MTARMFDLSPEEDRPAHGWARAHTRAPLAVIEYDEDAYPWPADPERLDPVPLDAPASALVGWWVRDDDGALLCEDHAGELDRCERTPLEAAAEEALEAHEIGDLLICDECADCAERYRGIVLEVIRSVREGVADAAGEAA